MGRLSYTTEEIDERLGASINNVPLSGNKTLAQLGLAPALQSDVTYYVSNSGSDETGDGTQENPFATFNHALGLVPHGLNHYTAFLITEDENYQMNGSLEFSGYNDGVIHIRANKITAFGLNVFYVTNCRVYLDIQEIDHAVVSTSSSTARTISARNATILLVNGIKLTRSSNLGTGVGFFIQERGTIVAAWHAEPRYNVVISGYYMAFWVLTAGVYTTDASITSEIEDGVVFGIRVFDGGQFYGKTINLAQTVRTVQEGIIIENGQLYTS